MIAMDGETEEGRRRPRKSPQAQQGVETLVEKCTVDHPTQRHVLRIVADAATARHPRVLLRPHDGLTPAGAPA